MSNEKATVECIVCSTIDQKLISKKGQFGISVSVVICKNCGLTFLSPRWSKERYQKFYRTEYDKYYRPELDKESMISSSEDNSILKRFSKAGIIINPKNILEIGAGAGSNLKQFRNRFPHSNIYAIEPSLNSIKILKENGVKVICEDADTNWEQKINTKFDVIIMRHVLEHFLNPLSILQKVQNCISETGHIYIAVPDSLNPATPILGNFFRTVHTYYFNIHSLSNICGKANIDIITIQDGKKNLSNEIFFIGKRSNIQLELKINSEHYETQLNVFNALIKIDNYYISLFKSYLNLYFPWIVKLKKKIRLIFSG